MPTYEYRCPSGHEFELFQSMSSEPRAACPECGEAAQRLLSGGAGLIFKGDGFYITDHRSEEYKKAASSDKESSDKESASPEKKVASGDSGAASKGGPAAEGAVSSVGSGGGSDGDSSKSKRASSDGSGASGTSKRSDAGKSSTSDD